MCCCKTFCDRQYHNHEFAEYVTALLDFPNRRFQALVVVRLPFQLHARTERTLSQGYCRSVADKYVECEFVLIAIDLALHRIQAYRHLLFNRKPFSMHKFHVRAQATAVAALIACCATYDAHMWQ